MKQVDLFLPAIPPAMLGTPSKSIMVYGNSSTHVGVLETSKAKANHIINNSVRNTSLNQTTSSGLGISRKTAVGS